MNKIESILGYVFANKELLNLALTHSSFANENYCSSNDRLEFLGDAVIELVVSDYIFANFPDLNSGLLTKLRASLVSTKNFNELTMSLGLQDYILKSKSLPNLSDKTKADLFESIIGAVYLDGGLNEAKKLIEKFVIVDKNNIDNHIKNCIDYKSKLQEEMQKSATPFEYVLINECGQAHDKTFEVELLIDGKVVAKSTGKSIHLAQENCAKMYFEK